MKHLEATTRGTKGFLLGGTVTVSGFGGVCIDHVRRVAIHETTQFDVVVYGENK